MTSSVSALETAAAAGQPISRAQAEELLRDPDLLTVGMLGELSRKAISGDRVTYGRVLVVADAAAVVPVDAAVEVRIAHAPASADEAVALVRSIAAASTSPLLTGFSLADLLAISGNDHLVLAELAQALSRTGLHAVAEAPVDRLGDTDNAIEVVRAALHGMLNVWRATVAEGAIGARLDLIERAVAIHKETSALRAFAPLPRLDPAAAPSTGYDDVRTVSAARLLAAAIPAIQVDWPLYGPKLAQVAIAYGANDIDGVAAVDALNLGHRRSPVEDIERQIRAAGGVPAARDGRYEYELRT